MAQSDNHPDLNTREGRQRRSELAPQQSTVPSGLIAGKTPAAQNTDTHSFPRCSTWLLAEILDMHCTVDDHRRHCIQFLKKNLGSPMRTRRALSDSCIRQCGPSTTAQCLQCQHTGNNPSLTTTICKSVEPKFIYCNKNLKERCKQKWYKAEFSLQRSSITIWSTFQHRLRTSS